MPEETTNQQTCGGKKLAMLAYGLVQISACGVCRLVGGHRF